MVYCGAATESIYGCFIRWCSQKLISSPNISWRSWSAISQKRWMQSSQTVWTMTSTSMLTWRTVTLRTGEDTEMSATTWMKTTTPPLVVFSARRLKQQLAFVYSRSLDPHLQCKAPFFFFGYLCTFNFIFLKNQFVSLVCLKLVHKTVSQCPVNVKIAGFELRCSSVEFLFI